MTPQETYKTLENDCFNLLTVDPNPPHDLNHFSLILGLENTVLYRISLTRLACNSHGYSLSEHALPQAAL